MKHDLGTDRLSYYPTARKAVRIIDCRRDQEEAIQDMADRGYDFLGIIESGSIMGQYPYAKLLFVK